MELWIRSLGILERGVASIVRRDGGRKSSSSDVAGIIIGQRTDDRSLVQLGALDLEICAVFSFLS